MSSGSRGTYVHVERVKVTDAASAVSSCPCCVWCMQWRRRAHPSLSLVLAVLGGFAVGALPMSAILIGVTR